MYKLIPLIFLLHGCIPEEDYNLSIEKPDFPCIYGWLFNYYGEAIVDPVTGEALRCDSKGN